MRDWHAWLRRELAELEIPPERLGDLIEELAQDLEQRARSARSSGASEEEADATAWEGLGSPQELRARLQGLEGWSASQREARELALGRHGSSAPLHGLGQDLRQALRSLGRSPAFAAVALLTLALGIGANTTLFSLVNALFLAPLPVSEPERVVVLYTSDFSGPLYGSSSYPDFADLRDRPQLFESLAAYSLEAVALTTDREPARVWSEFVSGGYFPTLGLGMALGRPLGREDDREGAAPAMVISHGLWQRRLGGSPSVVGRSVTLSGVTFSVVGVAPAGFTGLTRGLAAEAWVPLALRGRLVPGGDATHRRGSRFLSVVGRLSREVGIQDAQARLDVLAEQLRASYPEEWTDRAGRTRRLTLLREDQARVSPALRGPLLGFSALLAVVVGLVLLIACANVANLMLARASTRRREIAVRLTLGASRTRVLRHFLTESLLISALGGGLGVILTVWASQALRAVSLPLPVPVHLDVLVDPRVLAFAVGLTLVTGLGLGLAPALHTTGPDLVPALRDEAGGAGTRGRRLRRLFVAAQVALSMVLLIGASLLLRGLARATGLSPGFEVERVHLVPVDVSLAGYDAARASALVEGLTERTQGLAGVSAAALSMTLPLDLHAARRGTRAEGYVPQPGEDTEYHFGVVGPGYFDALGIPILRGREFSPEDREDAPGVAIVNETLAARFWPDQNPIGRTLQVRGEDGPRLTVVGLARDSKYRRLDEKPLPFYYLPLPQDFAFVSRYAQLFPLHVVVRAEGDARSATRAVTAMLAEIDPALPAYPPKSMLEHLGVSVLPSRVASLLFAAFGLLGLLLASLGVYGVVAYSVAQRTREIGVRIALGASSGEMLRMVLRDGLGLTAAGLAVGALLAAGLSQTLRALLFGLSPLDPLTFALVPLTLAAVALGASALPARRAARVDPSIALRYE
jgi:predicted permease